MGLKIIGASFGRTGTTSLSTALGILGFGPFYNMGEVIQHPEHVPFWLKALDGESVDWTAFFHNYAATVAYPAAYFWRELTALYPEAKVLLTVRDPERWYESVYNTSYWGMMSPTPSDAPVPGWVVMAKKMIFEKTFDKRFEDRAYAIGVYKQHNEEVQRTIPAARLLVYDVAEGWGPLCQFLACPVPSQPFPTVNTTAEYQARWGGL
jgi:hypothetical protein